MTEGEYIDQLWFGKEKKEKRSLMHNLFNANSLEDDFLAWRPKIMLSICKFFDIDSSKPMSLLSKDGPHVPMYEFKIHQEEKRIFVGEHSAVGPRKWMWSSQADDFIEDKTGYVYLLFGKNKMNNSLPLSAKQKIGLNHIRLIPNTLTMRASLRLAHYFPKLQSIHLLLRNLAKFFDLKKIF